MLAMAPSGSHVAIRRPSVDGDVVELVHATDAEAPRRRFPLAGDGDFAIAGTSLCLVDARGVGVVPLEGRSDVKIVVRVRGSIRAFRGRTADAIVVGDQLIAIPTGEAQAFDAGAFPLLGRASAPADGLLDAAPLFGGRLIAKLAGDRTAATVIVLEASGKRVHRVELPVCAWHAFAIERGYLLAGDGDRMIVAVDLRYGRIVGETRAPHAIAELVVDDAGRITALASPPAIEPPIISLVRVDDIAWSAQVAVCDDVVDEAVVAPVPEPVAPPPVVDEVPTHLPLALGLPPAQLATCLSDAAPFADGREHFAALLDLIAARAALAIADAWHAGRISADAIDHHPFEREVLALAGDGGAHAPAQLADARRRLTIRADAVAARVHASLAAGIALPFVELAHELALSAIATQVLLAVIAPCARGEVARLYRILANETARPTCDEALVATLLGDADDIAAELADGAPLVRHGLVERDLRGGLDVDAGLLARLRGGEIARSGVTTVRRADRRLAELVIDRAVLRTLVLELADPRDEDSPLRLVVRGRRGAGRHTLVATLAAQVGYAIACIDASQLPRGAGHAEALRRELVRARLARAVPVVSGVEIRDGDADHVLGVRHVLRLHQGPLVVRTTADAQLPLAPGFVDVELPALTEGQRQAALATAFDAAGIAADAAALAHRYRIGPGTIARIAAEARRRLDRTAGDPTEIVDEVARQHVVARIGSAAARVTRLASWDQVALHEDMLDSLRELIGRARHSRTVFEDWGYDRRIATARGLTALFYGPPGTGKTLVAGLVARELGLELYRVDLAKVMSKWVGETEKNLGEVFDAAEDGRLMLLFDEADSLFAKRSEVKSSNDRYANLEVNYLLQRLDAFEGVAILTTNLEGSIDPAFKRRLSMRLYFPFPDEDLRTQLWAAHVTPEIPTAGALDFAALARRFPLSGGYIRNSALRAAFLAAQERTPLSQAHLERAVLLEYRELGKLAKDGRME